MVGLNGIYLSQAVTKVSTSATSFFLVCLRRTNTETFIKTATPSMSGKVSFLSVER